MPWWMVSPHTSFLSLKVRETKVDLKRAENWCIGGKKVMDFDGKLNVADNEGRQTCVGNDFEVISWAIEEENMI